MPSTRPSTCTRPDDRAGGPGQIRPCTRDALHAHLPRDRARRAADSRARWQTCRSRRRTPPRRFRLRRSFAVSCRGSGTRGGRDVLLGTAHLVRQAHRPCHVARHRHAFTGPSRCPALSSCPALPSCAWPVPPLITDTGLHGRTVRHVLRPRRGPTTRITRPAVPWPPVRRRAGRGDGRGWPGRCLRPARAGSSAPHICRNVLRGPGEGPASFPDGAGVRGRGDPRSSLDDRRAGLLAGPAAASGGRCRPDRRDQRGERAGGGAALPGHGHGDGRVAVRGCVRRPGGEAAALAAQDGPLPPLPRGERRDHARRRPRRQRASAADDAHVQTPLQQDRE